MTTQPDRTKLVLSLALATFLVTIFHGAAVAQYKQFNLVSTMSPTTPNHDPHLVNAWGLALFRTSPFWVSDNGTGFSTLYDHSGTPLPLVVMIPPAPSQPFGPNGTPTGIVANGTGGFAVSESGNSG